MTQAVADEKEAAGAERLTLILALGIMVAPLVAAIILAAILIRDNADELARTEQKVQMIEAVSAAGRIVHELQRERGRSSGFIGSSRRAFPEELRRQRARTDAAIAASERDFAAIDLDGLDARLSAHRILDQESLHDTLTATRAALEQLDEIRSRVDTLDIERPAMLEYYTSIIALLRQIGDLNTVWAFETTGERVGNAVPLLQEAIEHAGLERAAGASGFGARAMDRDTLLTMTRLQAGQAVLLDRFRRIAGPVFSDRLDALLRAPAARRLDALRAAARDPSRVAGISAELWFATSTEMIDRLNALSNDMHANQIAGIADTRSQLAASNRQTASLMIGAIFLSLIAAVWQTRSFVHPIRTLATTLRQLAKGEGHTQVTGGERRDLVGLLARSVARLVEINTNRFRDVLYHAPIATSIEDLQSAHVRYNPAMARFLGAEDAAVLERQTLQDFMSRDDRALFDTERKSLGDKATVISQHEIAFERCDGQRAWGLATRCFVRASGGAPDFVITQVQDISEMKRVESMTANFVSTISHELRTPLTAVLAAIGMLHGKKTARTDPREKRLLDLAHSNCNRLLVLINDLLDMERLSRGGVALEMNRHEVGELVAATLNELAPYARGMEQVFCPLVCDRPYHAWTDSVRFSQVLSNLLTNAAKFSPRGSQIRVGIETEGGMIRVSVVDQGPGIDAAFAEELFNAFTQADGSASRVHGGSGVGLHLSRGLVNQLGGEIGFANNPDGGATFWFTVPAMGTQIASVTQAAKPGDAPGPLPRILCVEGDPDYCALLAQELDARATLSPVHGLDAAWPALDGAPFDLIVIAWELPDGSGMDLLQHAAISETAVPVIGLSTNSEFIRPARTTLNIRKADVPLAGIGEILMRVLDRQAAAPLQRAPGRQA